MTICQPLGVGLDCCPWALLRSPDVQELMSLRGWRETGNLSPDSIDLETRWALEAFGRGLADYDREYYDRLRKERESKAKK